MGERAATEGDRILEAALVLEEASEKEIDLFLIGVLLQGLLQHLFDTLEVVVVVGGGEEEGPRVLCAVGGDGVKREGFACHAQGEVDLLGLDGFFAALGQGCGFGFGGGSRRPGQREQGVGFAGGVGVFGGRDVGIACGGGVFELGGGRESFFGGFFDSWACVLEGLGYGRGLTIGIEQFIFVSAFGGLGGFFDGEEGVCPFFGIHEELFGSEGLLGCRRGGQGLGRLLELAGTDLLEEVEDGREGEGFVEKGEGIEATRCGVLVEVCRKGVADEDDVDMLEGGGLADPFGKSESTFFLEHHIEEGELDGFCVQELACLGEVRGCVQEHPTRAQQGRQCRAQRSLTISPQHMEPVCDCRRAGGLIRHVVALGLSSDISYAKVVGRHLTGKEAALYPR